MYTPLNDTLRGDAYASRRSANVSKMVIRPQSLTFAVRLRLGKSRARKGCSPGRGLVVIQHECAPSRSGRGVEGFWVARSVSRSGAVARCQRKGCGGRSGRWAAVLSVLRWAVGALGVRARAADPHARGRADLAAASRALPALRADARAPAGVVGSAPARQHGVNRRRAAGQSSGPRASHDRRRAGTSRLDGAWVAARIRQARYARSECLARTLDARARRLPGACSPDGLGAERRGRGARCRDARGKVEARDPRRPVELAVALSGGLLVGDPSRPPGY